jgi:AraC-like DNA-binding protein
LPRAQHFEKVLLISKKSQECGQVLGKLCRMSFGFASRNSLQEMIPLLIEVQQNLDRDLDLELLARKYGYSTFHFHRVFSNVVGETPKNMSKGFDWKRPFTNCKSPMNPS